MTQDPEQQFSLANQDTPYFLVTLDLKASGPMVVELPAGPYIGLIDDHNMDWAADLGTIGPGKGNGEKDVILPPLGIEIGKPFAPNTRQTAILETAASIGIAEMNVAFFANPRPEKIVWEGRH